MLKIVFISDTHNQLNKILDSIPEGDVLVHCGDATNVGNGVKIAAFGNLMRQLPHPVKIYVPGNHDALFEANEVQARSLLGPDIHCLINEGIEIKGVKFWGSPCTPAHSNWAFNLYGLELRDHWQKIPSDTDVLVTHGPPHLIGDLCENGHVGCKYLLKEIQNRVRPSIHACGHIHEGRNSVRINGTMFINASIMDGDYKMTNKPIIFNL